MVDDRGWSRDALRAGAPRLRCRHPRKRVIQYPETSAMESRSHGVLDTPLEPVIGLAEGETRWRGMTAVCGALFENQIVEIDCVPTRNTFILAGMTQIIRDDCAPTQTNSRNPMARVRCITEMGMGVDVHGRDATKAARRAVSDAIRHSSLGFFRMLGKTSSDMFVDVTIGVPDPGAVDTAAVAKELPYGTVTVSAVKGGLEIAAEQGGDAIIIANAAVVVSLDDGTPG
jgi:uncharacterized protein (TIGR02058 family)